MTQKFHQKILFFSLFSSLMTNSLFPCSFIKSKKIISFSSTITSLIDELGLIESRQIDALMSEHIKYNQNYAGKVLSGGLLLSQKELKKLLKKQILFFDESKKLEDLFSSHNGTKIKIQTRGQSPFEYLETGLNNLKPFLYDCEEQISKLKNEMLNLKNKIVKLAQDKQKYSAKYLFFLGKIENKVELPDMLISGDLFLLELAKLIPTIKSDQNYSYISEKKIKKLNKDKICFIGLSDKSEKIKAEYFVEKISSKRHNLFFRNLFLPGFYQVKNLKSIINNLTNKCRLLK
jgi:hypothetical protein